MASSSPRSDKVENLDARLALSGHGRPFTDVAGHIAANRALVAERLAAVATALAGRSPTAYEIAQDVYGERFNEVTATWLLSKTRCLAHPPRAAGRGAPCRRSAGALVRGA